MRLRGEPRALGRAARPRFAAMRGRRRAAEEAMSAAVRRKASAAYRSMVVSHPSARREAPYQRLRPAAEPSVRTANPPSVGNGIPRLPFVQHPCYHAPLVKAPGPAVRADTVPRQGLGIRPTKRHPHLRCSRWRCCRWRSRRFLRSTRSRQRLGVLAEIQRLDADLGHVIEAFNAEQVEPTRSRSKVNNRRLKIARSNLGMRREPRGPADRPVRQRSPDLVEIISGSASLDELRRHRVRGSCHRPGRADPLRGPPLKKEVKEREAKLQGAPGRGRRGAGGEARRDQAAPQQREALANSIKDEIAELEAAGAARINAAAEARSPHRRRAAATLPPRAPRKYGGVVGIAMQYLGTPYVGASPSGFDCSGFAAYVYAQVGVSLPHNAAMQYGYGSAVFAPGAPARRSASVSPAITGSTSAATSSSTRRTRATW